jgi:hypothetical protein
MTLIIITVSRMTFRIRTLSKMWYFVTLSIINTIRKLSLIIDTIDSA